ncbi:hypothetical protein C8R44DRAFT_131791 [Mycena epipterygia]|nr:hypothetical protein C8R44DRAFT_131791 [Mycena epipterygia]
MSLPPAKRQRTEDAPVTRSDIWISDGSVVLQADNTQFRVHWGVLALHSSFFRDMQGLPQPPDQPSIDGCPIVELQDAVADVEYLLKALYNPTFLGQDKLPLPVVGALIRLGRKYDFRALLDTAVERLTFESATTLEEFDLNGIYDTTRIVNYPGILYDMLTLARENKILSALPCAYFRVLVCHTQEELFDGISRGDGTSASLALIDLRRCVLGREKSMSLQFKEGYTLEWLRKWDHDDDCTDPAICHRKREALFYANASKPLGLSIFRQTDVIFCSACSQHIKALMIAGRQKTWEELPGLFDLPPWSELKNDL